MPYTTNTTQRDLSFIVGDEPFGFVEYYEDGDPNKAFTMCFAGPVVYPFEVPFSPVVGWSILILGPALLGAAAALGVGALRKRRRHP